MRSDLEENGGPGRIQRLDARGKPHGLARVPPPVASVGASACRKDCPCDDSTPDGMRGTALGDLRRSLLEGVQHRIESGRMERMRDVERPTLDAVGRTALEQLLHAHPHHQTRPFLRVRSPPRSESRSRKCGHAGRDVGFGREHGRHRATRRESLHRAGHARRSAPDHLRDLNTPATHAATYSPTL